MKNLALLLLLALPAQAETNLSNPAKKTSPCNLSPMRKTPRSIGVTWASPPAKAARLAPLHPIRQFGPKQEGPHVL